MSRADDLQKFDNQIVYLLGLFTQADQALEEIESWAQQNQPDRPDSQALVEAIKDCRIEVGKLTNQHNMVQGQIRQARHDAEQEAH